MVIIMRHSILFAVLILPLTACSGADDDAGPGGVSVGEAKALDEAAEMIEARRLPEEALPEITGSNAPLPPEMPAEQQGESE